MPQRRPSKLWFKTCVRTVSGTDKKAVCGSIWKRISPKKKRRIRRNKEPFRR